jgi:hypothetical protein
MELYGRNPARNGSQSGQNQQEWVPSGGEAGLHGTSSHFAFRIRNFRFRLRLIISFLVFEFGGFF